MLRGCLHYRPRSILTSSIYYRTIRLTTNARLTQHSGDENKTPSALALVGLAQPEWRLLSAGFAALLSGTAAQIAIPIGFSAMVWDFMETSNSTVNIRYFYQVDASTAGNFIGNLSFVPVSDFVSLNQVSTNLKLGIFSSHIDLLSDIIVTCIFGITLYR